MTVDALVSGLRTVIFGCPWQGYAFVATCIGFLSGWWIGGVIARNVVSLEGYKSTARTVLALLFAAVVFRVVVPKEPMWFGVLGDYLNPPLTAVSVLILAIAVGLQKGDLQSTRKSLSVARRQLLELRRGQRLTDSPWVIVTQVRVVGDGIAIAEVHCEGQGPALNVYIEFMAVENGESGHCQWRPMFYVARAVLFAGGGESDALILLAGAQAERMEVLRGRALAIEVRWQNVHRVTLKYAATLVPAMHGGWDMCNRLQLETPVFADASLERRADGGGSRMGG